MTSDALHFLTRSNPPPHRTGFSLSILRSTLETISVLLLVSLHTVPAFSQGDFERTYGFSSETERGYSVCQTNDGGYIISGIKTSGASSLFGFLIKTDAAGDTLWTRTLGSEVLCFSVQQTSDGGYIVGGEGPSREAWLIKTDASGNTLWTRAYAGAGGVNFYDTVCVRQTTDEGYIFVMTKYFQERNNEAWLIKTDASGDTLWTRTYGGPQGSSGYSVQQTTDGGYIIAGWEDTNTGNGDAWLIKTDASGDTLWTRRYGVNSGNMVEVGRSVQQTSDGGYVLAGRRAIGIFQEYVYLVKTDAAGDTLWTRTYGDGTHGRRAHSVQQTTDGGYIIAGNTGKTYSFYEDSLLVIRTDTLGRPYWTKTYGGENITNGRCVQQTVEQGFIVTGEKRVSNHGDAYLIYIADGIFPEFQNAMASDNVNEVPGIDDDDQVLIVFDEPTNTPTIDALNIDDILQLSRGHSWTDGFGTIGDASWGPMGDRLLITLSTTFTPPTVAVGDTITPDGSTITDLTGNPLLASTVITGSFDEPVGIDEGSGLAGDLPRAYDLSQNYPNPFNPSTTIAYDIPDEAGVAQSVVLTIYDVRGRKVRTLDDEAVEPGRHEVYWDGRDDEGREVGSGVYVYRLEAGDFVEARKMVVTR